MACIDLPDFLVDIFLIKVALFIEALISLNDGLTGNSSRDSFNYSMPFCSSIISDDLFMIVNFLCFSRLGPTDPKLGLL